MERTALKALVPRGYAEKIAKKAGVSRMTVSQFMNGKNDNLQVELATLEILAELSETKELLEAKIHLTPKNENK